MSGWEAMQQGAPDPFFPQPPPEFRLFPTRPICAMCKKVIPMGDTVYEINGYTGTFFECALCFTPEGEEGCDCDAAREVEMFRRNIRDLLNALEGKVIVDATFIVRYLKGLMPWDE